MREWERASRSRTTQQPDAPILPQYVIDKIYQMTRGRAVITTDVGQHQMWAAQYYHCQQPNNWVSSGGLGTMGFGLPVGGRRAGRRARSELVICIAGDGSLLMTMQELVTAVEESLPVKVAIINNQYLGMVRQWQQLIYDDRKSGGRSARAARTGSSCAEALRRARACAPIAPIRSSRCSRRPSRIRARC